MSLAAHIVQLERKHQVLEGELHDARQRSSLLLEGLGIGELKRRKLMIKDEIERLKHTVPEGLH